MAWVTWRQHRLQLLAIAVLLLLVAIAALVTTAPARDALGREPLSSCLPPAVRPGCDLFLSHFRSDFAGRVRAARYLILLPALAGMFVGAPLVARELEHGTFRLAWTQGITRRRWLLSKTSLLALVVVAGAGLLALVGMWWREPLDTLEGRMSPAAFDVEGTVVPAYALFALAVGVLAGLLLRRTLAAVVVAGGVFLAARIGIERLLRPNYVSPLHRTTAGLTIDDRLHDWVLDNSVVDAVGRTITAAREDLAVVHAQRAEIDPQQYLSSLGWRRVITYQPPGRFWEFQGIETAIFVGLAALAVLAAVLVLRRRPA